MNLFINFKSNTRIIWIAKTNLKKSIRKPPKTQLIIKKKKLIANLLETAEAFNEYYTNIAQKLDAMIPPSTTNSDFFYEVTFQHL